MRKYALLPAALIIATAVFYFACSGKNSGSTIAQTADQQTATQTTEDANDKLHLHPKDRYTAKNLDGTAFDSDTYAGRKIIFAFFSYKHKNALPMLKALEKIKEFEATNDFKIFAVSINYNETDAVKNFITANQITLPVLIDSQGLELAEKLGIQNEVALIGVDNRHVTAFGIKDYVFAQMPNGEEQFLDYMKENLAIQTFHSKKPILGLHPQAPDFSHTTTDGKPLKLSDYKGKVVLLLFFSPKCPHCQAEIKELKEKFYPEFRDKGLEIIAVSVFQLEGEMLETEKMLGMPWPVIDDHDRTIRSQYSTELGVPENVWIDKDGRIRYTSVGFSPLATDVNTMRARHLLGLENPPLLSDKHFNGVETCMVCHEAEYASWAATPHAHAWETLEIKGEDTNTECAGCHSIGMGNKLGWEPITNPKTGEKTARVPEVMQNVQCENCHGVGGPHKSPAVTLADMKKTCLECHTDKFSLHFDFDERVHKIDHSDASKIMAMPEGQRLELLKRVSKRPQDLFGNETKYVGSEACMSCHTDVYKQWKESDHGKTDKSYMDGPQLQPMRQGLKGADCESCHGPGEKHIASKSKKDIRGLGDDCPFCVIEQICMSCHDAHHDPSFNLATDLNKIKGHK